MELTIYFKCPKCRTQASLEFKKNILDSDLLNYRLKCTKCGLDVALRFFIADFITAVNTRVIGVNSKVWMLRNYLNLAPENKDKGMYFSGDCPIWVEMCNYKPYFSFNNFVFKSEGKIVG